MGGGPGGALTSQRRPTNFGALSTYKICASEWAADALAAWGGCPGVLFARGGDAGCARGRGGPLGCGRTLPIAAPVGKCCARWRILRPLRIDFFSLALIFGVKNTLACAQYMGRNQHTRVPSCSFLTHNTRTNTQKTRPRWASSTHKQKDGNMLALGEERQFRTASGGPQRGCEDHNAVPWPPPLCWTPLRPFWATTGRR